MDGRRFFNPVEAGDRLIGFYYTMQQTLLASASTMKERQLQPAKPVLANSSFGIRFK